MRRSILIPVIILLPVVLLRKQVAHLLGPQRARVEVPPRSDPPPTVPSAVQPRGPIVGYGTARAWRHARLSAEIAGAVHKLPECAKPGAAVRKDEELLSIDDREYQRLLERAESALQSDGVRLHQLGIEDENRGILIVMVERQIEFLENERRTVAQLLEEGVATPREYNQKLLDLEQARTELQRQLNDKKLFQPRHEQVMAALESDRADVEIARLNVGRCTVFAPFDGRISEVLVQEGDRVLVGQRLVSVLDPQLIEVTVELPIAVRGRVRVDAACTVYREHEPKVRWTGRVRELSAEASEFKQTIQVHVRIAAQEENGAPAASLLSGMFVRAEIEPAPE